jgi:protein-disulfide isomerase
VTRGAILWLAAAGALAAAQSPVEGRPESPVQVVIYEDLQCSDCAVFRKMMDDHLLARYGGKVAFVHRDFPLAKHAWARKAAIAARFFHGRSPELGLRYRRHALADRSRITADGFEKDLAAFAKASGVPPEEAAAALDNARLAELVEKDFQEGVARGISKTPTVLVNGVPFVETFTVEQISKGIDQALAEAH